MSKIIRFQGYQSIDTTVKGGFPVTFWYKACAAERDVGLMSDYIDDWFLTTLKGKPCEWLKVSEKEIDELHERALNGSAD